MTLLYFLLTIVLLVSIHEWGHFATARFFGVGVRSFTVGFGKQFVSWVDPKTGTSWGLAPYPVGGYVGLLDEKAPLSADGQPQHSPAAPAASGTIVMGKPFMFAPLYAKIAILFAGPLVNLVFAALLYAALAYTAPPPALPILAAPPVNSPAGLAGLQSGDEITAINGKTVRSWRDLQTALLHTNAGEALLISINNKAANNKAVNNKAVNNKAEKRIHVPSINAKQTLDHALGLRLRSNGLLVQRVLDDGAAQTAGVKVGDELQTVNGQVIDHPAVLLDALERYTDGQLLITVSRRGEQAQAMVKPIKDAQQRNKIGVQFAGLPQLGTADTSPLDALGDGFSTAYTASVLTIKAFGAFLLQPFSSDQLAGPITIAQTAKTSADQGWQAALAFIAGLSISVGVLNLLPVPMLDGGQILYHLVTNSARKLGLHFKIGVSESMNRFWSSLGIAFVLILTLLAFFSDGKRLLGL